MFFAQLSHYQLPKDDPVTWTVLVMVKTGNKGYILIQAEGLFVT
jgi:hypothetical protein